MAVEAELNHSVEEGEVRAVRDALVSVEDESLYTREALVDFGPAALSAGVVALPAHELVDVGVRPGRTRRETHGVVEAVVVEVLEERGKLALLAHKGALRLSSAGRARKMARLTDPRRPVVQILHSRDPLTAEEALRVVEEVPF